MPAVAVSGAAPEHSAQLGYNEWYGVDGRAPYVIITIHCMGNLPRATSNGASLLRVAVTGLRCLMFYHQRRLCEREQEDQWDDAPHLE